jgi:regulator of replication initiation timing
MAYAILRHEKIKSTTTGVANAHNHRLSQVQDASHLVRIDPSKSHLNVFYDGHGALRRLAGKLPAKRRKDAVVAMEILLSASPEFFDGIEKQREKLAQHPTFLKWVEQTRDWIKNEFGENVIDVVLHMDETSPHFHVMVVPITPDGRLCAKKLMAPFELIRRQTEYAKAVENFGLERGLEGSLATHVKVKEYQKAVAAPLPDIPRIATPRTNPFLMPEKPGYFAPKEEKLEYKKKMAQYKKNEALREKRAAEITDRNAKIVEKIWHLVPVAAEARILKRQVKSLMKSNSRISIENKKLQDEVEKLQVDAVKVNELLQLFSPADIEAARAKKMAPVPSEKREIAKPRAHLKVTNQ